MAGASPRLCVCGCALSSGSGGMLVCVCGGAVGCGRLPCCTGRGDCLRGHRSGASVRSAAIPRLWQRPQPHGAPGQRLADRRDRQGVGRARHQETGPVRCFGPRTSSPPAPGGPPPGSISSAASGCGWARHSPHEFTLDFARLDYNNRTHSRRHRATREHVADVRAPTHRRSHREPGRLC